MWKTDNQEKFDRVKDRAFKTTMQMFMEFLESQDKIVYASDLLDRLSYNYGTSWNGTDQCECILWKGILLKDDEDAQINIQISRWVYRKQGNDGYRIGEGRIYAHKKGMKLSEGWTDVTMRIVDPLPETKTVNQEIGERRNDRY